MAAVVDAVLSLAGVGGSGAEDASGVIGAASTGVVRVAVFAPSASGVGWLAGASSIASCRVQAAAMAAS